MNRYFVDTAAWVACADRGDAHHPKLVCYLQRLLKEGARLVTSDYVFDETVTLLRRRAGHAASVTLGRKLLESRYVELVPVDVETRAAAWDWFVTRSDTDFSFTDCTSFVLMQRLDLHQALTVDNHFRAAGFHIIP